MLLESRIYARLLCIVSLLPATSNALSGLMSQYAMDSYSDDNSDDDDNGEKLEEESASHTNDHRKGFYCFHELLCRFV